MDCYTLIVDRLKSIAGKINGARIRYGYDSKFDQHIVYVTPDTIFRSKEFLSAQMELECDFIDAFPSEELYFVTDGHGLELPVMELINGYELEVPLMQVTGLEFFYPIIPNKSFDWEAAFSIGSSNWSFESLSTIGKIHQNLPIKSEAVTWNEEILSAYDSNVLVGTSSIETRCDIPANTVVETFLISVEAKGENSCAMAA